MKNSMFNAEICIDRRIAAAEGWKGNMRSERQVKTIVMIIIAGGLYRKYKV